LWKVRIEGDGVTRNGCIFGLSPSAARVENGRSGYVGETAGPLAARGMTTGDRGGVDLRIRQRMDELQISPLRYAPVEMTKGRGVTHRGIGLVNPS